MGPVVQRVVEQRLQLGQAGLRSLGGLGAVARPSVGGPPSSGRRHSTGISTGSISWLLHPHQGDVSTRQEACLGGRRGAAGPETKGPRGEEQQQEVEGGAGQGQGQADCPGAAAEAPDHPAGGQQVRETPSQRAGVYF